MDKKHALKCSSLLVLTGFIITQCVFVSAGVGFVDPDYKTFKAQRLAVYADKVNLQTAQEIEDKCVWELKERAADAVSLLTILPPTREYTADDRSRLVKAAGVDAVLVIALAEEDKDKIVVPGRAVGMPTDFTTGRGFQYFATGGYDYTSYNRAFSLRLIDPSNMKTIWVSELRGRDVPISTLCIQSADQVKDSNLFQRQWTSVLGVRRPVKKQ